MDIGRRTDFRVIAEGDDAVGRDLTLAEALALLDLARKRGRRYVAIVDDATGAIVDERRARRWVKPGPPPLPSDPFAPCPACHNEAGVPTGDVLVQLPSGTWVRDTCDVCNGRKKVSRKELAQRIAQVVDEMVDELVDEVGDELVDEVGDELVDEVGDEVVEEPTGRTLVVGQRKASGTRPRVARVLVVYDEPLFAEALQLALSREFEVKVATDAHQALASMMVGDWYDVVLCEVMMPGLNGIELRNLVHAASPDLAARIVFIGGVLPERVRLLLESVPNTCLEKPVDLPALCDLIRRRTFPGTGTVGTARAR